MGEPEDETFVVDLHFDSGQGGGYTVRRSTHAYVVSVVSFSGTVRGSTFADCLLSGVMIKHSKPIPPPSIQEYIKNCCTEYLSRGEITDVVVRPIEKWQEIVMSPSADTDAEWFRVTDGEMKVAFWTTAPKRGLDTVLDVIACLHARLGALQMVNVELTNRSAGAKGTETGKFTILPKKLVVPKIVSHGLDSYQKTATGKTPHLPPVPLLPPVTQRSYTVLRDNQGKISARDMYATMPPEALLGLLHQIGFRDEMDRDPSALQAWFASDPSGYFRTIYDKYKTKVGS